MVLCKYILSQPCRLNKWANIPISSFIVFSILPAEQLNGFVETRVNKLSSHNQSVPRVSADYLRAKRTYRRQYLAIPPQECISTSSFSFTFCHFGWSLAAAASPATLSIQSVASFHPPLQRVVIQSYKCKRIRRSWRDWIPVYSQCSLKSTMYKTDKIITGNGK